MATDGTRSRLKRVGGANHGTTLTDDVLAFPNHGNDGSLRLKKINIHAHFNTPTRKYICLAVGHVVNKAVEEGTALQVSVVLFGEFLRGNHSLQTDELVAAFLEAGNDLGNETALNAIGLIIFRQILHVSVSLSLVCLNI